MGLVYNAFAAGVDRHGYPRDAIRISSAGNSACNKAFISDNV